MQKCFFDFFLSNRMHKPRYDFVMSLELWIAIKDSLRVSEQVFAIKDVILVVTYVHFCVSNFFYQTSSFSSFQ